MHVQLVYQYAPRRTILHRGIADRVSVESSAVDLVEVEVLRRCFLDADALGRPGERVPESLHAKASISRGFRFRVIWLVLGRVLDRFRVGRVLGFLLGFGCGLARP